MSRSLLNRWAQYDLDRALDRRHRLTLDFVTATLDHGSAILDLGAQNAMGGLLSDSGYQVANTDADLDENPEAVSTLEADAATAFEILEHLVNPRDILRELKPQRLFATIPLRLWFAPAYRNLADPWDQHFHEFEDWQFDWLLDSAGWEIIRREKWPSRTTIPGVRPMFRAFVNRYYAVEAVRRRK